MALKTVTVLSGHYWQQVKGAMVGHKKGETIQIDEAEIDAHPGRFEIAKGRPGRPASGPNAQEVIVQIGSATNLDELDAAMPTGESRRTVKDAYEAKLANLAEPDPDPDSE